MRLTKSFCLSFLAALGLTALGIMGVGGSDIFRPAPVSPAPALRPTLTIAPPTPQELQPWLTPPRAAASSGGSGGRATGPASPNAPLISQDANGKSGSRRLARSPARSQPQPPPKPARVAHSAKSKRRQTLIARRRPMRLTFPARRLALGTIHVRRPGHGMTIHAPSGTLDLRRVVISAHYVVDDPNNRPPLTLNKFIGRSTAVSTRHLGSTARCLPTGGNTIIAGSQKVLWGTHDHITGLKYCLPGGGGLPGQPTGQEAAEPHQGGAAERPLSPAQEEQERLARNDAALATGPLHDIDSGRSPIYLGPEISAPRHALHLPASHQSLSPRLPGVLVPKAERRLVDSPRRHVGSAASFTPDLVTIGSLSARGTVPWPSDQKHPGRGVKRAPGRKPAARTVLGTGKKDGGGDGSGLMGSYYTGRDFAHLEFQRPDRGIDFDWTGSLPDPRMPPAQPFSVRWLGKVRPRYSEAYTFYTASDDGVRLWVDGRLLISNWTIHGDTEDTGQITLKAGHEYDIKLEVVAQSRLA